MFLRQPAVGRDPLAVAMCGVRMGERVLQIGVDDPRVAGALGAKPGLSGESVLVVADDTLAGRVRRSIEATGALVNIQVHPIDSLPFPDASFDLVVVHNRADLLPIQDRTTASTVLRECHRVLRTGGRLVVLERGTPTGLASLLRARPGPAADGGSTEQLLEIVGFRTVRVLADRDNYRFVEGLKA